MVDCLISMILFLSLTLYLGHKIRYFSLFALFSAATKTILIRINWIVLVSSKKVESDAQTNGTIGDFHYNNLKVEKVIH